MHRRSPFIVTSGSAAGEQRNAGAGILVGSPVTRKQERPETGLFLKLQLLRGSLAAPDLTHIRVKVDDCNASEQHDEFSLKGTAERIIDTKYFSLITVLCSSTHNTGRSSLNKYA